MSGPATLYRRPARRGIASLPALVLPAVLLAAACGDDAAAGATPEVAGATPSGPASGAAPDTTAVPPLPVATVAVPAAGPDTDSPSLRTSGTLAAEAEVELAFKVAGYVAEIRVDEGDAVRAGQVLARLQDTEVQARVGSARTRAEVARKNLDRMERLLADSVVPEARVDEAREAWEQARAGLQVAEYDATHAVIRAPADGRVLRRAAESWEFVAAGRPVLRLGAVDGGWIVRVSMADRDVVRVRRGDAARVTLPALGDTLSGAVTEIADQADPSSGTFEVEVGLPPDDVPATLASALRSGMVARVELRTSGHPAVVHLPTQALVDARGRDAAVFVVENGRARRTPVRVERIEADGVAVRAAGLRGSTVVSEGAAWLRDGDPVEDRSDVVASNPSVR